MSIVEDLQSRLETVKSKAEGDLRDLVKHLEAAFQHLHISHAEPVVKEAVASELHMAAIKVDNIANQTRMEADLADKAIDTVDNAVNKAAKTQ